MGLPLPREEMMVRIKVAAVEVVSSGQILDIF